jgi:AcrR family transcriptional regulator
VDPSSAPQPRSPADRRHRRSRLSRARIRAAARNLFLERGFDATTVDDIVGAADLAQKTFFNHFPTKDALLQELASSVLGHFERLLSDECKRSDSLEARLGGFFSLVGSEIEVTRVLSRDLLHRIIRGSASGGTGNQELRRVRQAFRGVVADGRERGDVGVDLELEVQADLVAGAFIGVVLQWLNEPGYPLAGRLRDTAHFLAAALAPRRAPGRGT